MSDVLTIRTPLAAPPQRVYRALTDAEALRTWFAEHAEVSLAEQRYEFWGRYTPQGEPGRHRLLAAEPDRLLHFEWRLDARKTTVELRLEPDDAAGTVLSFSQDGMPTLEEMMAPTGRRDGTHTMHTFWPMALGNLAQYAEGRELVPRCDFSNHRSKEIRLQLTIDAPAEEVFTALTEPTRIARWWGWEAEVEPWVGGRITLGADGKIFEFDPDRTLAYAEESMITRWELADSGGRTHLTFVQSGFSQDELDNAAQNEAGWLGGLVELKRLHELGTEWRPLNSELPDGPDH